MDHIRDYAVFMGYDESQEDLDKRRRMEHDPKCALHHRADTIANCDCDERQFPLVVRFSQRTNDLQILWARDFEHSKAIAKDILARYPNATVVGDYGRNFSPRDPLYIKRGSTWIGRHPGLFYPIILEENLNHVEDYERNERGGFAENR